MVNLESSEKFPSGFNQTSNLSGFSSPVCRPQEQQKLRPMWNKPACEQVHFTESVTLVTDSYGEPAF